MLINNNELEKTLHHNLNFSANTITSISTIDRIDSFSSIVITTWANSLYALSSAIIKLKLLFKHDLPTVSVSVTNSWMIEPNNYEI